MPRPASGEVALPRAFKVAAKADTAEELRVALAVLLPLRFGLTLKNTAMALGRSVGWVSARRQSFIASAGGRPASSSNRRGGRRNELMPESAEGAFMDQICANFTKVKVEWLSGASMGPTHHADYRRTFVEHVQQALEKLAGRPVSLATAYNLMARVGKRRFDTYHASAWTIATRGVPIVRRRANGAA